MASSFLQNKARESRARVDKAYGSSAYGGSSYTFEKPETETVKLNPLTSSLSFGSGPISQTKAAKLSSQKFNPLVMIPAKDTIKTGLAKAFPAAQKQAAAGGKVPDGDILRQPPENAGIAGLEKSGYNKSDTQDAKGAMKEYLEKTGKQLLLGNYTDDVTLLGTLGQIGLGLANLDLPMDVRDLTYDLTHWKWTPGHVGQTLLDVAGFLPVVGSVKYLDEAGTLVRNAARNADEAGEILSGAARGGVKALTGGAWETGEAARKYMDKALDARNRYVDKGVGSMNGRIDANIADAGKTTSERAGKTVDDAVEGAGDKADILAQNRAQGREYEQKSFIEFNQNFTHSQEQITVKTQSSVKTRLDAIGFDTDGKIVIHEFKSSASAPLTKNQKFAFPEIFDSGATVQGKGKGIFTGGYNIPAGTDVKVIRPPK